MRPSISQGWTRGWGLEAVTDLKGGTPPGRKVARTSSEQGTEEFLLPEGVLRGGHRGDEGVLAGVSITVSHQVGCSLGHLGPNGSC